MNQLFGVRSVARVGLFFMGVILAGDATAAEVEQIFVRAKAGYSIFSKLDPVSSAFAVGLDLGFRSASGFGVTGVAKLGLEGNAYQSGIFGSGTTRAKTRFLGIVPTYSVTKGVATLSFGLGLGTYALTTNSGSDVTTSRFALAPEFQADFAITQCMFLNIGASYITSLGKEPNFGEFLPMAGIGFQF